MRAGLLAVGVALLTACGGGGGASVPGPTVAGAWARPTPPGATDAVVYFELRVAERDTLVRVAVEPSVAATASFHTTTGSGRGSGHQHGGGGGDGATTSAGGGSTTAAAVLGMEELEYVTLVPGKPTVFEPGGNHVMLERLARPLVVGERFDLTLTLASGATLVAPVAVATNPPG